MSICAAVGGEREENLKLFFCFLEMLKKKARRIILSRKHLYAASLVVIASESGFLFKLISYKRPTCRSSPPLLAGSLKQGNWKLTHYAVARLLRLKAFYYVI
jgi:hypothetical protein